eukprot:1655335-Prorocentrum_lima.AAC.1
MQGRAETQYPTMDDPGPHNLTSATIGRLLLRSSIPSAAASSATGQVPYAATLKIAGETYQ